MAMYDEFALQVMILIEVQDHIPHGIHLVSLHQFLLKVTEGLFFHRLLSRLLRLCSLTCPRCICWFFWLGL